MAGDLEDFLRRAAERRAQKQQAGGGGQAGGGQAGRQRQQRPTPQAPRPKPEYTEARRERQVRQEIEEAIPVAEIVEPVNPLAEQQRRLAESKRKAEEVRAKMAEQYGGNSGAAAAAPSPAQPLFSGDATPAEQLLELLQRPGGIQQAFLLREILERPQDRWD